MVNICFDNSPYRAVDATYPNKFKPWEFKQAPMEYWTIENGIIATKWLIEEKLNFSNEDIKEKLSVNLFERYGLLGMLQTCFGCSPYRAVDATYPNTFKLSDFNIKSKSQ